MLQVVVGVLHDHRLHAQIVLSGVRRGCGNRGCRGLCARAVVDLDFEMATQVFGSDIVCLAQA